MVFINLNDATEQVDFRTAVLTGLGRRQGLFFPDIIEPLENLDALLAMDFVERSTIILGALTGNCFAEGQLAQILQKAFNFPLPLVEVEPRARPGSGPRARRLPGPGAPRSR